MDPVQKPNLIHLILLNRPTRMVTTLIICAVILPVFSYMIWFSREIISDDILNTVTGSCSSSARYRVQCGSKNVTPDECTAIHGCYTEHHGCAHRHPAAYQYRQITPEDNATLRATQAQTPFGHDTVPLGFCINEIAANSLDITLCQSGKCEHCASDRRGDTNYWYEIDASMFALKVHDKKSDRLVLSTSRGPLVVGERYFEWSMYFGENVTILGFGDYVIERLPYRKILWWDERQDFVPELWAIDNASKSVLMVRLTAVGPIEIEISKGKLVSIRTLRSERFSLRLVMETTVKDLLDPTRMQRVLDISKWELGVHVVGSINETNDLLQNLTQVEVPFDSIGLTDSFWLFDDTLKNLADREDLWHGVRLQITALSQVPITSEAYQSALALGILLRNAKSSNPYHGTIENRTVAYIDWTTNPDLLTQWLREYLVHFNETAGIHMTSNCLRDDTKNEPLNTFGYYYIPEGVSELFDPLVPLSVRLSTTTNEIETDLIRSYTIMSTSHLNSIAKVLGKPITSSSWMSHNPQTFKIWRNRYSSTWQDLQMVFRQMMSDSLHDIPLSGANVCGDVTGDRDDEELCVRWYQLASVGSLFQISSSRTPDKFGGFTRDILVSTLRRRYALIPYLYSVLLSGRALIRPFVDFLPFSYDSNVLLVGPSLVICPILHPEVNEITLNLPADAYDLWGGRFYPGGVHESIYVGLKHLPMYLMSGHIIAMQPIVTLKSNNMDNQRMTLVVGLRCEDNQTDICSATGNHNVSPTISFSFEAVGYKLTMIIHSELDLNEYCEQNPFEKHQFDNIRLYHTGSPAKVVSIDFDMCREDSRANEMEFYFD